MSTRLRASDRLIYRRALNLIGVWRNDESVSTCPLPKSISGHNVQRIAKIIAFASGLEISSTRREQVLKEEGEDFIFEFSNIKSDNFPPLFHAILGIIDASDYSAIPRNMERNRETARQISELIRKEYE